MEGFEIYDETDSVPVDLVVLPGFRVTQGPSSVEQPKGAGKLPIVFTYEGGNIRNRDAITVTATPIEKTVTFSMTVGKYIYQYNTGFGPVTRIAGLLVDGSSSDVFANSEYAAFSYNPTGHGVMISGSNCVEQNSACEQNSGFVSQNYGQKTVQEQGWFDGRDGFTDGFTYRVF